MLGEVGVKKNSTKVHESELDQIIISYLDAYARQSPQSVTGLQIGSAPQTLEPVGPVVLQDLFGTLLQEAGPVSETQIPQQGLDFAI